jgi:hypothetical protein
MSKLLQRRWILFPVHCAFAEHAKRLGAQTGLRGMAGNKGAVAIRLDFHDTSICFVTAHFAAGTSNVAERNADYVTISGGLHFLRGKTISDHE